MSGERHTPGPWKAKGAAVMAGDEVVARMIRIAAWSGGSWDPTPNALADARLIAAAPDLLAALRDAIGALEQDYDAGKDACDSDWEGLAYQRLQAARAAIHIATTPAALPSDQDARS